MIALQPSRPCPSTRSLLTALTKRDCSFQSPSPSASPAACSAIARPLTTDVSGIMLVSPGSAFLLLYMSSLSLEFLSCSSLQSQQSLFLLVHRFHSKNPRGLCSPLIPLHDDARGCARDTFTSTPHESFTPRHLGQREPWTRCSRQ